MTIDDIVKKAFETHDLNKSEIIALLTTDNADTIYAAANETRRAYVGDDVHLRALIEFSNHCRNDCLYCGIRKSNTCVQRYRMSPEKIVSLAQQAKKTGYQTVVLQGGEDMAFSVPEFADIIAKIKASDVAVTLSIGERPYDDYRAYRDAGADRFLLRIETTDKALYEKYDPHMRWENRKRCLIDLKKLGYEVGSGFLVGLPDQTIESTADDILFLKETGIDMAGIGPFIPHPQTPLKDATGGTFDAALRAMAVTRLILPDINIPATTAMETLTPNGRMIALNCGANVIMPNVTDADTQPLYALYPGKAHINDAPASYRAALCAKIVAAGRTVGKQKGFRGEFLKTSEKNA